MKVEITSNLYFIIALVLAFIIPAGNMYGQIILGLAPLILFFLYIDVNKFRINYSTFFIFLVITVSLIINIFIEGNLELKSLFRYFSFAVLFLLFPFSKSVKIPNYILYLILVFIVLSQLAFVFGISSLVSFYDTYYLYEGDVRGYTTEFILQSAGDLSSIVHRRYGGIYHNPNQLTKYVSVLFLVFLLENRDKSFKMGIPFIMLVFLSVLLTGSRTGIVVLISILISYFIFIKPVKHYSSKILTLTFVLVALMIGYFQLASFDLRVFEISTGIEGSLGTKFTWFNDFYTQLDSPVRFLFGHFTTSNLEQIYGVPLLDSEWGELFYSFGIFGVLSFVLFYYKIYRTKDKRLHFFLLILLWGVTSTVIFSFKMSLIFMLLLSNYYSLFWDNRFSK